ncbi:MAG: ferrous iron transport protein B [Thermodesulfobacteriota bacterium]
MEATLALAGNPNSGKTTLFNELTGARQHVGNYPGITVERREGIHAFNGHSFHIVDLPGTYSLTAYSREEIVARDFLVNGGTATVVNIVDAANLERNLYLSLQLLELGLPICIALNMIDVAEKRGLIIDTRKLSELLRVPVVATVARTGMGKTDLMAVAAEMTENAISHEPLRISYGEDLEVALTEMEADIAAADFLTDTYPARWIAVKYMENDLQILERGHAADPALSDRLKARVRQVADHLKTTLDTYPEAMIADGRYGYIHSILKQGVVTHTHAQDRLYFTDRIDQVLLNRFFGPIIMLAVMLGLYQFTFTYSEVPVGWFESLFGWLAGWTDAAMPDGALKSLLVSGIIEGVGGVLGFVPLILFMFLGIAILEDSGYLARVAFMLDRVFSTFGLHGASVMPFIISGGIAGGCAVPGVMAARTLKSPRERLATLLTVPFMNCGAKLPVLALLIGAFFAHNEAWLMFGFTLLSWAGALLVAKLLRMTLLKGEATPFVMELPPYRLPTFKGLAIHTFERVWQYVKKAGTVILGISVLLWAMMTFPGLPDSETAKFEAQQTAIIASAPAGAVEAVANENLATLSEPAINLKERLQALDAARAEARLRNSIAGRIGTALESVSKWAGFNWRINIALVGGFAAKEVVVSTLGTAYSLGETDPEEREALSDTLINAPEWSPLVALSLIVFIMFYAPCFVSVVCIAREAGSWKWGLFSMAFNTLLAFSLAVLVYQVGSLIGG